MNSFKEFMILNEGYGVTKPFNRYKTFEMFATAPENITKAVKALQAASFTLNSTFNSNLDPKTNIKKGDPTKSPIEAYQYAIDKSSINNGGMLLQAMAITNYILNNVKQKTDENEDHGISNKSFFDKVKMHLATNKPSNSEGAEKNIDVEIKKITAKINNLRKVYESVTAKGKNINLIFKNAQEIVSNKREYFDSSSYDELNKLFVKKNVPPVPPKKETSEETSKDGKQANKQDFEDKDSQTDSQTDSQNEPEDEGGEEINIHPSPSEKKIELNREAYKEEINNIVNDKLEELKKRFNIQEGILKTIDNTLTEMFRKTHGKNGEETEYYQKKKVLSSKRYFKQIEDIRNEAIKKLDALFSAYDEQYITKNKKSRIGIKIRQLIPQLKIDLNNASYKMFKDLTQNEVGIGVDAIKSDFKNVTSSVKKAVKSNTTLQKAADFAKTTSEKIKDTKSTFDKNLEDAKNVHAKGGDAGLVGKTLDVKKAVNDRLKNVFFGRKKASETNQQSQPQQPQYQQPQAALPAPQVVTQPQAQAQEQPQQTYNSSKPIILPDNTPKALPTPEEVKKREAEDVKKRFKPKYREDDEEYTDVAKKASLDTDKIKKVKKSLRDRLR